MLRSQVEWIVQLGLIKSSGVIIQKEDKSLCIEGKASVFPMAKETETQVH